MIPKGFLEDWKNYHFWVEDYQTEQDLVIERAVCEMFADDFLREHLAFRGGTALHKLYLSPQIRYSEDIDLVQISSEPINPILKRIRERLSFLGTKLRALYQRRKGRDLFDLYYALTQRNVDCEKIIECFKQYMSFSVEKPPTQKQFLANMEEKIILREFIEDTFLILNSTVDYNHETAWETVKNHLVEKI